MSKEVRIFEVGPRDGLQNEARDLPFQLKVKFVRGLLDAGLRDIELGAFVRSDRVPAMADTDQLYREIHTGKLRARGARFWSLVPNRRGLDRAIKARAMHLAVFTAATDSFSRRNIGMSVDDSLREFAQIIELAKIKSRGLVEVRGYISTAFGCPFEGRVTPRQALRVIEKLAKIGVFQVSIGDTIGVATPAGVEAVLGPAIRALGAKRVAGHFHDTRGGALANALRALELGVRTLDSSAGGLGGCPFAPGASGNLATEDLVYMLHGMGMKTGVDLKSLCEVSLWLARKMKRPLRSRYLQAYRSER